VVVLRAVSLLGLALWVGGLATIGLILAPAINTDLDAGAVAHFERWTWGVGALLVVVLIARALLGPRPRWLGWRVGTVLVMLALSIGSPRWIAPRTAMFLTLAAGVGLIWAEAADDGH
jgi:hypothetical protein